jgi:hypothetical protein
MHTVHVPQDYPGLSYRVLKSALLGTPRILRYIICESQRGKSIVKSNQFSHPYKHPLLSSRAFQFHVRTQKRHSLVYMLPSFCLIIVDLCLTAWT